MTIKKLAALATAAALALCMLAGCYGGSRAVTSVLLDMVTITVGTSSPGAKVGGVVGYNSGTVYNDCKCNDGTVTVGGDENPIQPIGGGNTNLTASEGGQQSAAVAG